MQMQMQMQIHVQMKIYIQIEHFPKSMLNILEFLHLSYNSPSDKSGNNSIRN